MAKPKLQVVLCLLAVAICSTFSAYWRAFSNLTTYDDEGTMMLWLKRFLDGRSLYDQIPSIYGPLFYWYEWCAHRLAGVPVSHDSVRFVSIAFWLAATLAIFLLIYRATGSLLLAAATQLLTLRALGFLGLEPSHPQEACILLLALLGIACYVENPLLRMAMFGALTGGMAVAKINLGAFVAVALAIWFIARVRPLAWAMAFAFPAALIWGHRTESWALEFAAITAISLTSVILTVPAEEGENRTTLRDVAAGCAACAATIALFSWFALAHGSTVRGMIESLIVKPRSTFGQLWFLPAPFTLVDVLWALAGLALAWYAGTGRGRARLIPVCKLALGIGVFCLSAASRYADLIAFAAPFLWLVAVNWNVNQRRRKPLRLVGQPLSPAQDGRTGFSQARQILAMVTVAQVLYAYPVAGSQIDFAAVMLIAAAGICLWDAAEELLPWPVPRWASIGASLAVISLFLVSTWRAHERYQALEPLNLPGALRLRIEPERAAALRTLVDRVKSSCGTLVTEPGLYSLNLWSGHPAPADLSFGGWMNFLNDAQQEAVVREVSNDPRACVIKRQDVLEMWTRHRDVSSQPLPRFISENFQTVLEIYGYRLMERKNSSVGAMLENYAPDRALPAGRLP